jgi:hypothetical protein
VLGSCLELAKFGERSRVQNSVCAVIGEIRSEKRLAPFRISRTLERALINACWCPSREYPMEGVTVETGRRGDSFTIRASSAEVEDLQHLPGAVLFVCELRVLAAEYCQRRAILYLPGTKKKQASF